VIPLTVLASVTDRILGLPGWLVLSLVFALPALEASAFIGFVFPGEIAVLLGGVVASQHRVSLWAVVAAAVCGAIFGDSAGYLIGRRWGRSLLQGTIGRLPLISRELDKHLDRAQAYVRRRKGSAVFFGRFTAALRVLVPGLAGMSGVPYPTFFAYNVAGGLLWGAGFSIVGYVAGASYKRVEQVAGRAGLLLLILIVAGLALSRLFRRLRERSPGLGAVGERVAGTRPLSWIRRRFPRQVAWARARLAPASPRGFPLIFTLAVGTLAAWSFGGLTQDVVGRDDMALLDPRVTRWVVDHRTGWLTTLSRNVTWLGSSAVIVPALVLVAGFFLLRRHDWRPGAKLAAAVGGAIVLYDMVKPIVDRQRPSSAIWIGHYSGGAFPSGHATQAVAFYAMIALVFSGERPAKTRALLWSVAGLIAVLVGASRLYLGAHWLSDVLGGYALGAAWVAFVVAIALITSRPRTPMVESLGREERGPRRSSRRRVA
jgi:membrane protein DedA with SNARE-associated domain/membrane-associated phospholipid phosphatase